MQCPLPEHPFATQLLFVERKEKNKWYRFKFKSISRQRTTKNVVIYLLESEGKFEPSNCTNYILFQCSHFSWFLIIVFHITHQSINSQNSLAKEIIKLYIFDPEKVIRKYGLSTYSFVKRNPFKTCHIPLLNVVLLINHCITLSSSFLTMFVHHAIFGLWVVLRTSKRKSKIFSRVLQFNEKEKLIDWNNLPFCHWHLLRFGISSYINVHLFSYIISLMWHSFCLCMITYPLSIILSWCATFWVILFKKLWQAILR